mmetsp:Transcript_62485/g.148814  ORF Transcript_62485/g.148814 Transcript_62485/m.148814 type:complete len:204 (-) Transcript_62485:945-1556(-)
MDLCSSATSARSEASRASALCPSLFFLMLSDSILSLSMASAFSKSAALSTSLPFSETVSASWACSFWSSPRSAVATASASARRMVVPRSLPSVAERSLMFSPSRCMQSSLASSAPRSASSASLTRSSASRSSFRMVRMRTSTSPDCERTSPFSVCTLATNSFLLSISECAMAIWPWRSMTSALAFARSRLRFSMWRTLSETST